MTTTSAWERIPRQRLARHLRNRGWAIDEGTLRHRIYEVVADRHRSWWDWGHPAMLLVGRHRGGNTEFPRGEDLWWIPIEYVEGPEASLVADFEQRHGCYITWSYSDVRRTGTIPWRIFDLQDDGHTIVLGLWPCRPEHGGRIQPLPWGSLTKEQMRLLLWWYLAKHKAQAQWFGARTWVYGKALHAVVHDKKPFSCKAVPGRGSGGYDHWHCQLGRRHPGPHRFRNYTWSAAGRVEHVNKGAAR